MLGTYEEGEGFQQGGKNGNQKEWYRGQLSPNKPGKGSLGKSKTEGTGTSKKSEKKQTHTNRASVIAVRSGQGRTSKEQKKETAKQYHPEKEGFKNFRGSGMGTGGNTEGVANQRVQMRKR